MPTTKDHRTQSSTMNETVSDSGATWQVFPPGSRVTIDGSVADVYWQESRPREHLDLTGTESQDRLPAGCYQTSKGHLLGKKNPVRLPLLAGILRTTVARNTRRRHGHDLSLNVFGICLHHGAVKRTSSGLHHEDVEHTGCDFMANSLRDRDPCRLHDMVSLYDRVCRQNTSISPNQ